MIPILLWVGEIGLLVESCWSFDSAVGRTISRSASLSASLSSALAAVGLVQSPDAGTIDEESDSTPGGTMTDRF